MKKNRTGTYFPLRKSRVKILMVMKLTFLLVLGFVFSLSASVRAQDQIVTLKVKKTPFSKVISEFFDILANYLNNQLRTEACL